MKTICCAKEEHFYPVFISFRVAEASKEAAQLQARQRQRSRQKSPPLLPQFPA